MIGRTLSHYQIVAPLGRGGMGVVYRAHDLHLERDVALKVLPEGALADEAARKRFRREALALSKLNHPHIATVHDFDSQEGMDFLVMELVEGQSLAESLKGGALPEAEVLKLANQIVEALAAAHERGVVHRDLKPSNIVVSEGGRAKILDFGLARLIRPEPGDALTRSLTELDVTVGTLSYMAPEQLLARKVDARADLYSLGVVLYELATGRLPYREKIPTALIYEIMHQPVTPPREVMSALSPRLEAIILRCLEKDPERRYSSARDLVNALREPGGAGEREARAASPDEPSRRALPRTPSRPSRVPVLYAALVLAAAVFAAAALDLGGLRSRFFGASGAPTIEALAVLPLENLSGDSTQTYFADGMTDELITRLAQISALRVRPRASVMQFRGTTTSLPQIARELQVDAVVTGSVLKSGEQARISAQLVRTRDDVNLWADSFEGNLKDVLALQARVARAVAEKIRVKLSGSERASLAAARSVDPRAHEAYLKGQYFMLDQFTFEGLRKSIQSFDEAIRIDPTWAPAYAGLADAYNQISSVFLPANEAMPRAEAAAMKALELDPESGDAYGALAYVKAFYDWKWQDADAIFRRAIALQPGSAILHGSYGYYLWITRRNEESSAEIRRALEIDPLSVDLARRAATPLRCARRFDDAIAVLKADISTRPEDYIAHAMMGQCYLWKKDYESGLKEILEANRLDNNSFTQCWVVYAQAAAGHRREALRALEDLKTMGKTAFVQPYFFAIAYAGLGDRDRTFEQLERGIALRSEEMCDIRNDPAMDGLRSDPRYADIVGRLGFGPGPSVTNPRAKT